MLKGNTTAAALTTLAAISESSTNQHHGPKRSKRSKTSFEHHNLSVSTMNGQ